MKKFTPQFLLGSILLSALAFVVYAESEKTPTQDKNGEKVLERKADAVPVSPPTSSWIGVQVVQVPNILLSHFGVDDEESGLVAVRQVVENSPASDAGLKRGDVILSFGGKDVHSLADLVRQVGEAGESEQKMQVVRAGKKTELVVTPAPRPHEAASFPGSQDGRMLPFRQHGMRIGPEIWLGSRDPQEMMREMEDRFRQMQGEIDDAPLQVLPEVDFLSDGSAKRLEVTSKTDQDGKTTIHVRQWTKDGDSTEEKTWEADGVDELPDEIRADVQKIFGK